MKRWIVNIVIISFWMAILPSMAQSFEKSKTYSESFHISDQKEVGLENKYGDIQIINWEKDSVKIEVHVQVVSNKEAKADKVINSIKMNFKENHFYIIAKTDFLNSKGFWTDVSDISKNIFNSNTNTKVDYIVHIPNNMKLNVTNKYGNVFMGDYEGEFSADISNGDLKAHYLNGKSNIKISFGDFFVEQLKRANLEFNYVEAHMEQCHFLEARTRASKLYISSVDELSLDSGHDKYFIDNVNKVYGISKFSYIKFTNLESHIDLIQKYGTLQFKELNSDVDRFFLETYKTEIHLGLISENNYLIDFRSENLPEIQYPSIEYDKQEEILDKEKNLKSIKVTFGNNENKKAIPLNIHAVDGKVYINVK